MIVEPGAQTLSSGAPACLVPLWGRPDLVPAVAAAMHAQWGEARGRSPAETLARFRGEGPEGLPFTLLALQGETLAGAASLRVQDSVDYLPGATPWICNVWVAPQARRQGLAGRLCAALMAEARRLGYRELFLATTRASGTPYHRLGFVEVARSPIDGGSFVLRRSLDSPGPLP